jgi:hypothetical protein
MRVLKRQQFFLSETSFVRYSSLIVILFGMFSFLNAQNATKLQVLLPGIRAAPGPPSG